MSQEEHTLIRRMVLTHKQKPVPIFTGDPPQPIDAHWAGIINVRWYGRETFVLTFFRSDGLPVEFLQFETLEIALDQGEDIAGIDKEEWQRCHIPVTDPEGRMTWQG